MSGEHYERRRSRARALFFAMGVGACANGCAASAVSDANSSGPTQGGRVASVNLTPRSATLFVNDSVQLVAAVIADAGVDQTVVWASSDGTRASVTPNGLVRAVSPGSATIFATSRADATKSASIVATVIPRQSTLVAAGLTIVSINSATTSTPANLSAVAGSITVAGQLTAGSVASDHLELLVSIGGRDSIVSTASTSASQPVASASSFAITFTTDARDSRGSFRLANGTYGIRVRAIDLVGNVLATSSTISLTLANLVPVAAIYVSPQMTLLAVGATAQLIAELRDANNVVVTGRTVTWTSSDPNRATISSTGLVTAIVVGPVTISAECEGQRGYATVDVSPAIVPVANVSLSPSNPAITIGTTVQLTATTTAANGNILSNRIVTWSSSDPSKAAVSNSGVVTGIAIGTATISATSEGKTGATSVAVAAAPPAPVSSVTVTPFSPSLVAGTTIQMSATPRDASGNVLINRVITWASSDPSHASVSQTSGLVTGVATGSAIITATSENQTGSATVTVTAAASAPVASVIVTPSNPSIVVGGTIQMTAVLKDANGNVLSNRTLTWASSDPARATVGQTSGVVTGIAVGTATITATSEGKSASTVATTTAPAPTVAVTVAPLLITIFDSVTVSWTSTNATSCAGQWDNFIASLPTAGSRRFQPTSNTTYVVQCTGPGGTGSDSKAVTVATSGTPATVTVTPSSNTLFAACHVQLNAQAKDSNGNLLSSAAVQWSTSNNFVASVSQSGLVTANASGSATISATSGSASGQAAVQVQSALPGTGSGC
ncbi:MAG: Ig domain protein group 2 domain protein [Gemmatimonadetes bacterium]|nr:Ig domain protein group 2 domain protein [Gemmatimonadota bacterium]